jgi:hypothetical protein
VPSHLLDDVQHWRDRVKKSRVLAEQIDGAPAREMMFRIAENYERMAEKASRRQDEGQVQGGKQDTKRDIDGPLPFQCASDDLNDEGEGWMQR